jgi:hypothetical protein
MSGRSASPVLEFTESLAPGEAVQYILQPSSEVADTAPQGFKAAAVKGMSMHLSWLEAPGASYEVLRADGPDGNLKVVASGIQGTEYTDSKLQEGTLYTYAVRVSGSGVMSATTQITATGLVPLDRSSWKVTSNVNTEASSPANAIDGDRRTRWDTGKHQASGEYFQIDLGTEHTVEAVDLDYTLSSYDYPRGYTLQVSDDGKSWRQVASGKGKLEMTKITFSQVKTRYIRILQTGAGGNYWSIQELQVYSRE